MPQMALLGLALVLVPPAVPFLTTSASPSPVEAILRELPAPQPLTPTLTGDARRTDRFLQTQA